VLHSKPLQICLLSKDQKAENSQERETQSWSFRMKRSLMGENCKQAL
jgi:hypothetical protein